MTIAFGCGNDFVVPRVCVAVVASFSFSKRSFFVLHHAVK